MTGILRHGKGFGCEEAKVEPGLLRRTEKVLVSEHEAAMADVSRYRWNLSVQCRLRAFHWRNAEAGSIP